MRLMPLWVWLAGASVVLSGLGAVYAVQIDKAYDRGVAAERAAQLEATQEAQKLHEAEIAQKQAKIDAIAKNAADERFRAAARYSALQQTLSEIRDEEFSCPADKPVFPERLRQQLDALGRR